MGDMLSQAEIDALLSGALSGDEESNASEDSGIEILTPREIDALGEIGNICMGTSATTLFTLLGHKVGITTPKVSVTTWEQLSKLYPEPYVAVKVKYVSGVSGDNLLILQEDDAKVITDLMMGGSGQLGQDTELTELHLSAISEAMNQMIGSAATSLSSMFDKRVEISPPESIMFRFNSEDEQLHFDKEKQIVKIEFSLTVGNLIDSVIMQLLPIPFAKELVANLYQTEGIDKLDDEADGQAENTVNKIHQQQPGPENWPDTAPKPQQVQTTDYSVESRQIQYTQPARQMADVSHGQSTPYTQNFADNQYRQSMQNPQNDQRIQPPVNVQPAQFQSFDTGSSAMEMQNIGLLMDVPLQVTVELGRTNKKIKEILEFGQGSIIELDKLAGEPVDILVNGKNIAKGEVVVIDESFGVRITDIIHPSKRL